MASGSCVAGRAVRGGATEVTAAPLLELRDLHVAYGKVEALHGVALEVPAGAIVSVIGPNGA
ncbi:MAG: hypothetical protein ACLGIT_06205, partial [Gammaproteobacteria bacterium]